MKKTLIIIIVLFLIGITAYQFRTRKIDLIVSTIATTTLTNFEFVYETQSLGNNPIELKDKFVLKDQKESYVSEDFGDVTFGTNRRYWLTSQAAGELGGRDVQSIVLTRHSGNNIYRLILFVFLKDGGAWKQITYIDFPPDGGKTTIDNFSVKNDSIVLNVKTSGPDRNYHDAYVSKTYTYELVNNKLVLQ